MKYNLYEALTCIFLGDLAYAFILINIAPIRYGLFPFPVKLLPGPYGWHPSYSVSKAIIYLVFITIDFFSFSGIFYKWIKKKYVQPLWYKIMLWHKFMSLCVPVAFLVYFCDSVCVKVKVLVTQSCPTLYHPTDCSLPDSSIHGIFRAVLECVPISFSRRSSNPGIEPRSPTLQADSLLSEPPGKPNFFCGHFSTVKIFSVWWYYKI